MSSEDEVKAIAERTLHGLMESPKIQKVIRQVVTELTIYGQISDERIADLLAAQEDKESE